MSAIHIPPLAPEVIGHIGQVPVTNTMINAWLAMIILFIFGLYLRGRIALRPGRLQNVAEYIVDSLAGYFDQVTGSRAKTYKYLPLVGSVFFFILLSNWLGLMPGTGTLTFANEPLFRPANTDLNLTVAMALVSVLASHILAFGSIGFFVHLNKFLQVGTIIKSLRHGPIAIFTALIEGVVGIIEIIGEAAKVLSLSLRLFGNIFAGEVLISVISALVSAVVPLPFMLLELLVGLIQASVFAMLTLVYLTVAGTEPHGNEEHGKVAA